jgi:hypothetical protein
LNSMASNQGTASGYIQIRSMASIGLALLRIQVPRFALRPAKEIDAVGKNSPTTWLASAISLCWMSTFVQGCSEPKRRPSWLRCL